LGLMGLMGIGGLVGVVGAVAPVLMGSLEIVSCLQLVVAQLEELVVVVVLPPRHVERGAKGEVTTLGIVFNGHIGDGAPAVVAGHIGKVEQQVGLDGEQLATGQLALQQDGGGRELQGRGRDGSELGKDGPLSVGHPHVAGNAAGLDFLELHLPEVEHEAGRAQIGEVVSEQSLPQAAAPDGLELLLEAVEVLVLVSVAQVLHQPVVGIAGSLHHDEKRTVVLDLGVHAEQVAGDGEAQARGDEVVERLHTLASQLHIGLDRPFGRRCTAQGHAHQDETVVVELGNDVLAELVEQLAVGGQVGIVHGEHHAGSIVEERFVRHFAGLLAVVENHDVGVGLVEDRIGQSCRARV